MELREMNTALLRMLAYDAARALNYAEAARLYQAAADAYPTRTGALAKADIAKLEQYAATYRQGAEYQAKVAA